MSSNYRLRSIKQIINILEIKHISTILVICGKQSFKSSGVENDIKILSKKFSIIFFNNFSPNPCIDDLLLGINVFKQSNCEAIISIGGGSCIDMGKLINYFNNLESLISEHNLENSKFDPKIHICIPTTAGSGSESTCFAVLYFGKKKYSISDPRLIPNSYYLNPKYLISQSAYQKAVSGIDALAQCIESIWSINSSEESISYAKKGLNLLWNNLKLAIYSNEIKYLKKVSLGANLSGKAINISKTTSCHALSYPLSKHLNIPHGHSIALTLPIFIKYNSFFNEDSECSDKRGVQHVMLMTKLINKIIGATNSDECSNLISNFIQEIGIQTNYKIYKEEILPYINIERSINNPKRVTIEEYSKIIEFINQ